MFQAIFKYNKCHEPGGNSKGGQFCSSGDTSIPKGFDAKQWGNMPFMEKREAWKSLSRQEKDAMGSPRTTVKARMDELLSELGERPNSKDIEQDITDRIDSAKELIPDEARKLARKFMGDVTQSLTEAGVSAEGIRQISMDALDHLLSQDIEAQGRTLGDHGIHHLKGDADMAKDILSVLPGNHNSPENRLMMNLAAVYHDAGYLTPPSRAFLDADHPRWSAQYFNEHVSPMLKDHFSKDYVQMLSQVIYSHDHTGINWETEPELSAFSTADNMALFHKEKMPPVVRYVPANTKVLVDLAQKQITVEEAQTRMLSNIANSSLTKQVKSRLSQAVPEVSGLLPKFTLGMVGTKYEGVSWNTNHLVVDVSRTTANEELGKVLDLGQKQFQKLAETYGKSPDDFIKDHHLAIDDGKKTLLEVRLHTVKKAVSIFKAALKHYFSPFTAWE